MSFDFLHTVTCLTHVNFLFSCADLMQLSVLCHISTPRARTWTEYNGKCSYNPPECVKHSHLCISFERDYIVPFKGEMKHTESKNETIPGSDLFCVPLSVLYTIDFLCHLFHCFPLTAFDRPKKQTDRIGQTDRRTVRQTLPDFDFLFVGGGEGGHLNGY